MSLTIIPEPPSYPANLTKMTLWQYQFKSGIKVSGQNKYIGLSVYFYLFIYIYLFIYFSIGGGYKTYSLKISSGQYTFYLNIYILIQESTFTKFLGAINYGKWSPKIIPRAKGPRLSPVSKTSERPRSIAQFSVRNNISNVHTRPTVSCRGKYLFYFIV